MHMGTRGLAAILALGISGVALGQGLGPPPEGPPGGPREGRIAPAPGAHEQMILNRLVQSGRFAEELGLSAEQIEQLRAGLHEIQDEMVRLKADLEMAALRQARILTAETMDEAALMAAVEAAGAANTALAKNRMRALLLMHATLTAEQRDQVRARIAKRLTDARQDARVERERGSRDWRGEGGPRPRPEGGREDREGRPPRGERGERPPPMD